MTGLPHRSPVQPQRQVASFNAQHPEGPDLLRLGRLSQQAGMLRWVVEREHAPKENLRRSPPAVADILGFQCLVDPPADDAAHYLDFQAVGGGEPFGDQVLDESKGLHAIYVEIEGKLRPAKHPLAMKADQRLFDPSSPTVRVQSRVPGDA